MGVCQILQDRYEPAAGKHYAELSKSVFQYDCAIGKGGFGRVWKVVDRRDQQPYALKEMLKSRVIYKKSARHVLNERQILALVKHPFLVNMQYAFQDQENLYLVMDLISGGDLRFHLNSQKSFTEEQSKFFVACVLTGLEYLHVNNIIHRDIKPENLVLDARGYVRITDFGMARVLGTDNPSDASGTPGYMSPEALFHGHQSFASDYFSLGVTLHEFMLGRLPYASRSRHEYKEDLEARAVVLRKTEIPKGWSLDAGDFLNKLLEKRPQHRLGFNGPLEVKRHAWLKDFPWQRLLEKTLSTPLRPASSDNFSQAQSEWNDHEAVARGREVLLQDKALQEVFAGYYYDPSHKLSFATALTAANGPDTNKV